MSEPRATPPDARTAPVYLRAIDPFPLESPDFNKLHEFYAFLAVERLTTTRCRGCGRIAWPPQGFCPACRSEQRVLLTGHRGDRASQPIERARDRTCRLAPACL